MKNTNNNVAQAPRTLHFICGAGRINDSSFVRLASRTGGFRSADAHFESQRTNMEFYKIEITKSRTVRVVAHYYTGEIEEYALEFFRVAGSRAWWFDSGAGIRALNLEYPLPVMGAYFSHDVCMGTVTAEFSRRVQL